MALDELFSRVCEEANVSLEDVFNWAQSEELTKVKEFEDWKKTHVRQKKEPLETSPSVEIFAKYLRLRIERANHRSATEADEQVIQQEAKAAFFALELICERVREQLGREGLVTSFAEQEDRQFGWLVAPYLPGELRDKNIDRFYRHAISGDFDLFIAGYSLWLRLEKSPYYVHRATEFAYSLGRVALTFGCYEEASKIASSAIKEAQFRYDDQTQSTSTRLKLEELFCNLYRLKAVAMGNAELYDTEKMFAGFGVALSQISKLDDSNSNIERHKFRIYREVLRLLCRTKIAMPELIHLPNSLKMFGDSMEGVISTFEEMIWASVDLTVGEGVDAQDKLYSRLLKSKIAVLDMDALARSYVVLTKNVGKAEAYTNLTAHLYGTRRLMIEKGVETKTIDHRYISACTGLTQSLLYLRMRQPEEAKATWRNTVLMAVGDSPLRHLRDYARFIEKPR